MTCGCLWTLLSVVTLTLLRRTDSTVAITAAISADIAAVIATVLSVRLNNVNVTTLNNVHRHPHVMDRLK